MIQGRQPKKIKGLRKKLREESIENLQCKFPTWFENKTDREIIDMVNAFKNSGKDDEEFPSFCIEYESLMDSIV